uniref:Uncharacterized protein n=1 Tax=Avena sativa TaxID=4498 RepID=A0ACD5XGB1_AVESA
MGVADGGGEGDPAVVPPITDAMATASQQAVGARIVAVPAEMLDCHACLQPLKPPIYKCDAEHRVCGATCRGVHAEACSRPAAHSRDFDAFAAAATVLCDYEGYGCRAGGLVYHLAADHCRACPHAPCGCPERGCAFFGSRQMLLSHVSGPDHSRPVVDVLYGQPRKLSLPLSRRWYLLVGEEDRAAAGADRHRNVFLVSVGEGATTAVSVVCVRSDGGAPGAAQFSCRLAVEHPGDGTMVILESPMMSSSSLSAGAPTPREVRALPVPSEYLSGDAVPLIIHINKLEPPARHLHPTAPAAATAPSCPASATSPPWPAAVVKLAGIDQSNRRKAPNPRNLCM